MKAKAVTRDKFTKWMTAKEFLLSDLENKNFKVEKPENELLALREEIVAEEDGTAPTQKLAEDDEMADIPDSADDVDCNVCIADTMAFLEGLAVDDKIWDDSHLEPMKDVPYDPLDGVSKKLQAVLQSGRRNYSVKCNLRAMKKMKSNHLYFATDKLFNGYYQGFMATVLCENLHIIEAFPCREKRLYWLPSRYCKFCQVKAKYPTYADYKSLDRMYKTKDCSKMKHYVIKAV